jgi:hypothetical protein
MKLAAALLLALAIAASAPAACAESQPISEAETALFMADYLGALPVPSTLRYGVVRRGTLEPGFSDTVELDLKPAAGAARSVETRCLSGDRRLEMPGLDFAQGNPALLCFLERDIREMERLTGGKSAYFRKRIRLALAGRAQLKPATFSYNGRPVAGTEIRIAPYEDDPLRGRYERYAGKVYVFRMSNEVPGGLIGAAALIPAGGGAQPAGADPLLEEALTLAGSQGLDSNR